VNRLFCAYFPPVLAVWLPVFPPPEPFSEGKRVFARPGTPFIQMQRLSGGLRPGIRRAFPGPGACLQVLFRVCFERVRKTPFFHGIVFDRILLLIF
jgi:hypothetical protein